MSSTIFFFQAAERARWFVSDYPIGHVGFALVQGGDLERFRSGSTKVVDLVDLLDQAKSHYKAVLLERGIPIFFNLRL